MCHRVDRPCTVVPLTKATVQLVTKILGCRRRGRGLPWDIRTLSIFRHSDSHPPDLVQSVRLALLARVGVAVEVWLRSSYNSSWRPKPRTLFCLYTSLIEVCCPSAPSDFIQCLYLFKTKPAMLVWNARTSLNMTALSLLGAKLLWAPGCTTRLYCRTIAKSGAGRE